MRQPRHTTLCVHSALTGQRTNSLRSDDANDQHCHTGAYSTKHCFASFCFLGPRHLPSGHRLRGHGQAGLHPYPALPHRRDARYRNRSGAGPIFIVICHLPVLHPVGISRVSFCTSGWLERIGTADWDFISPGFFCFPFSPLPFSFPCLIPRPRPRDSLRQLVMLGLLEYSTRFACFSAQYALDYFCFRWIPWGRVELRFCRHGDRNRRGDGGAVEVLMLMQ
jgi:hypothetical protein